MSSYIDYNYIFSLISIQENVFRIGGPILIVLGTVSNILSLIVFSQKNLRKNPCSIYFMAFNIANLILIYASLLPPTLQLGYSIDASAYNLSLCRMRIYLSFVFNCFCPFCLILASIDRIFITSPSALTRRRSTCRNAYIFLSSAALFWMLFLIHVPVFSTIMQLTPTYFYCDIQPGSYTTGVAYGSLAKEILTPLLMLALGLWSVRNIRQMRRVAPVLTLSTHENKSKGGSHSVHAKDRQLIFMLLIDIGIYILFSLVLAVSYLYTQFRQGQTQSLEEVIVEALISNVAIYSSHVPFCITSYAHLFVSKTFRSELKNIILCK